MNNSIYSISSGAVADNVLFDFSNRLNSLTMLYDYENYVFPIISINTYLTIEEYKKLVNRNDLNIVLSLRRMEASYSDNAKISNYEYCFKNKVFKIVNEPNYYFVKSKNRSNQEETEALNMVSVNYILIQEEDLESNKKNLSGSFANCTLKSLLVYMMNQLNQNKKTIIAEPSNNNVYEQILIPYNTILNTFEYLDTVYGVYSNGIKVFFDLDSNYVLNKNANKLNNDLSKDVIFDIKNTDNALYDTENETNNTITVMPRGISYNTSSLTRSEYIGTNNSFIMNDSDHTILNKSWNSDATKTKVYYQKYSNKYLSNQITPENDTIISLDVENANYNLINFINEYYIKEYLQDNFKENSFTITSYTHSFIKAKDNSFSLNSNIKLRKIT